MSKNFYLRIYKDDEPVNRNQFMKHRKVFVQFNPKFLEKIVIDEMIKKLPLKFRQVIILHVIKGYPVKQIAKYLEVHRSTVHRRLIKALDMLSKNT